MDCTQRYVRHGRSIRCTVTTQFSTGPRQKPIPRMRDSCVSTRIWDSESLPLAYQMSYDLACRATTVGHFQSIGKSSSLALNKRRWREARDFPLSALIYQRVAPRQAQPLRSLRSDGLSLPLRSG
jgi:hypothetical protein